MTYPLISVVVPIYNAQEFLSECIDSILEQTFCEWELILVDDGSTDESLSICKEYEKKDDRIKIFHQQNGGVTSARRLGVNNAFGEWVTFIDADDILPRYALKCMYDTTFLFDTDLIVGMVGKCVDSKPKILSLEEWREACISGRPFHVGPVAKLYKRELFSNDMFNIPSWVVKGEDMLMNIRIAFAMSKQPVILYRNVYHYRVNNNSCVHTFIPTLDYEEGYHELRKQAMNSELCTVRHLHASIQSRLDAYLYHVSINSKDSSWNHSEFVREIKKDALSSNFKIPMKARMLFATDNSFLRQLVVLGWETCNYFATIKYKILHA